MIEGQIEENQILNEQFPHKPVLITETDDTLDWLLPPSLLGKLNGPEGLSDFNKQEILFQLSSPYRLAGIVSQLNQDNGQLQIGFLGIVEGIDDDSLHISQPTVLKDSGLVGFKLPTDFTRFSPHYALDRPCRTTPKDTSTNELVIYSVYIPKVTTDAYARYGMFAVKDWGQDTEFPTI